MTTHPSKKSYSATTLVSILGAALLVGACGGDETMASDSQPKPGAMEEKTIVGTAQAAGVFNTLVAALGAGDLASALEGEGPFTVFAPTDEAFAKLPAGTVEDLLKPENKESLQKILKYHVVSGKVLAADVVKLNSAATLEGGSVDIMVNGSTVMINNATVTQADVMASNGVIHVVDSVLLPK
jgi:uncharacterized surface protein with fasciclin (FAS1) repeats